MTVFFIILAILLFVNILLFRYNAGASSKINLEPELEGEEKVYPKLHLV